MINPKRKEIKWSNTHVSLNNTIVIIRTMAVPQRKNCFHQPFSRASKIPQHTSDEVEEPISGVFKNEPTEFMPVVKTVHNINVVIIPEIGPNNRNPRTARFVP